MLFRSCEFKIERENRNEEIESTLPCKFLRSFALEGFEGRKTRRRESGHFPIIGVAFTFEMISLLLRSPWKKKKIDIILLFSLRA